MPYDDDERNNAVMQGYTGNQCSECENFTMVRNGTTEKCDTCGCTDHGKPTLEKIDCTSAYPALGY